MAEAWIPLECVECGEQWESTPSELPTPGTEFTCDHCGANRPVSEFVKTQRGFEILTAFHA